MVSPWPFSDQNIGLTDQTCNHSAIVLANFPVETPFDTLSSAVLMPNLANQYFKWLTKFHIAWSLSPSNVKWSFCTLSCDYITTDIESISNFFILLTSQQYSAPCFLDNRTIILVFECIHYRVLFIFICKTPLKFNLRAPTYFAKFPGGYAPRPPALVLAC